MIPALVRPAFVERMEAELLANEDKGCWKSWHPTVDHALNELHHHAGKIRNALRQGDRARVAEFAADAANICMKIDECFGGAPADDQPPLNLPPS